MQAPPETASDLRRFVALSEHLAGLGLSAPRIIAADADAGCLLVEDLGDDLFPTVLDRSPELENSLYSAAIDCLFHLQAAPPPDFVTPFTAKEMARQAALAHTTLGGAHPDAPCPYEPPLFEALSLIEPVRPVLMLRDFHAGNLFWLPDRRGIASVGLIDFQDARLASPLYDVVSLLWDARRDLPAETRRNLLGYCAHRLGRSLDDVGREAAILSAQRNLRILGVFARLARDDGKTGYLEHMPRVWRHVEEALAHPDLSDVSRAVRSSLPPPDAANPKTLEARCPATPAP